MSVPEPNSLKVTLIRGDDAIMKLLLVKYVLNDVHDVRSILAPKTKMYIFKAKK